MLTFRGAPSGKALEAWRDNFSLKVGATKIPALISKKYSKNIGFGFWMGFDIWMGKEGARARGPPDLGPNLGPWAQNLGSGRSLKI